jgi:hypothetical protein
MSSPPLTRQKDRARYQVTNLNPGLAVQLVNNSFVYDLIVSVCPCGVEATSNVRLSSMPEICWSKISTVLP